MMTPKKAAMWLIRRGGSARVTRPRSELYSVIAGYTFAGSVIQFGLANLGVTNGFGPVTRVSLVAVVSILLAYGLMIIVEIGLYDERQRIAQEIHLDQHPR